METFGQRVRRLRKARKMTQAQVAKAAGIDQSTVSDIERGVSQGEKVTGQTLLRLAAALGTNPEYLSSGRGRQDMVLPSATEAELLAAISILTPANRAAIMAAIQALISAQS